MVGPAEFKVIELFSIKVLLNLYVLISSVKQLIYVLILSVKHPIFGLEDLVSISGHVVRSILERWGVAVLEIKALKLLCRKHYDMGTLIVGSKSINSASL